jgi:hypothetical protein
MDIEKIKKKFEALCPHLNEQTRRLVAASETIGEEYGIISAVSRSTGVSRRAISKGIKELKTVPQEKLKNKTRIRMEGGGRKSVIENDPTLKIDLESLLEPATRGDPESPLIWTCKSLRMLVGELAKMNHIINHQTLANLLRDMGYSLQANKKTVEGNQSPDRNEQFKYINEKVKSFQADVQPVISVDTKKKEIVGNFKNKGQTWRPKGSPEKVNVHDFEDKELGKVIPFGIYDLIENTGWVNVGLDHDTSAFAVASIRGWWENMGKEVYPSADKLMITADGGGSNGYRRRLWKTELQSFANETKLSIYVTHFPPGTSKWNKIEHRLFSFISQNWRGKPLISYEVIVNLIGSTKTKKGLKVQCRLDENKYQKGIKVTDEEMDALNIERADFHGEWNYIIHPEINA